MVDVILFAKEERVNVTRFLYKGAKILHDLHDLDLHQQFFLDKGKIKIDKEETLIVRHIYSVFLKDGLTRKAIADTLKAEGVLTPSKKGCNWTVNNITSILTNEKYKGDVSLQKVYCEDLLEHKMKKNNSELSSYYVENSHPRIIDKEECQRKYDELAVEFDKAKSQVETLQKEKHSKINQIDVLEVFVKEIECRENAINEFSTELWNLLIKQAVVHKDKTISFIFKNETKVRL